MEENVVVYRFQKNPEEEVRFSLREYRERQYVDLRIWFLPASGSEYHPSKRGLTLGLNWFGEVKKGIERMDEALQKFALQPVSGPVKSHNPQ